MAASLASRKLPDPRSFTPVNVILVKFPEVDEILPMQIQKTLYRVLSKGLVACPI
jgi:hypothetical protein